METDPKPRNLAEANEFVSVENPISRRRKPGYLLRALLDEHYPPGFLRKVVAETIATYLLVFVTCGSAALSAADENRVSKLGASVAGGLIVTVMIYAVGHISGAHMNPAVTLAFAAVRHFPWKQARRGSSFDLATGPCKVPVYAAAQLGGAISAAFTLRVILHPIKDLGTTSPTGTEIKALVTEIVVTFTMMFTASAVATDTKAIGELAGLAVGSAVCITSIFAGGSMNPARTIGPALASASYQGIWVYFVGPVTGTLLGAWAYKLIRVPDELVHSISTSTKVPDELVHPISTEEQRREVIIYPENSV